METLGSIFYGFGVSFQLMNLFYCFVGVLIGTLVGVLPGIGPAGTMAILLPVTFHLPSVGAIIMLAGIYYGAMYGGSTTAILVNIPGEAASVVTCIDGYVMARKGRAGPALGISAFGSFIAGTLALFGLTFIAAPLAKFALKFGPPEYFSLLILSFCLLSYLSRGSTIKALMMAGIGLILGSVGMDTISGKMRFTYGMLVLEDGIGLIPVLMGLFGISEVFLNIERAFVKQEILKTKIKNLFPNLQDWKESIGAIFRGSGIGFFFGIFPGASAIISTFVSYAVEKKISKNPEKFGKGAIEGVAGPESANNATATAAFIPMFSLGIPPGVVTAILIGALMIQGVHPGPFLIAKHPDIFWGTVASMYTGNIMLLVLNLPLIPMWVQILKVPYPILFPLILLFCVVGAYSMNNSVGDIIVMNMFGIVGFLMNKFKYDGAPLIMAMVLGGMFEIALRQSLMISDGEFSIFITRPISLGFLIASFLLLLSIFVTKKRPAEGLKE